VLKLSLLVFTRSIPASKRALEISVNQLELFCAIAGVIVILSMLTVIALMSHNLMDQSSIQMKMIQTLTNLAASKDISAFAALEAGSQSVTAVQMPYVPQDDESVARHLAEQYAKHGLDPNMATTDDSDPLADFGGKEAFL